MQIRNESFIRACPMYSFRVCGRRCCSKLRSSSVSWALTTRVISANLQVNLNAVYRAPGRISVEVGACLAREAACCRNPEDRFCHPVPDRGDVVPWSPIGTAQAVLRPGFHNVPAQMNGRLLDTRRDRIRKPAACLHPGEHTASRWDRHLCI